MTTVYNDNDLLKIRNQKQKIFYIFLGVTFAYLAFCIGWLIYYISLPYADPMQKLPKILNYIVSGAYVMFVFPFMGIKYSRIRKYYKMVYYLSEGLKNVEENYFVGFEKKDLQKDNVDAIACIFKTWNRKKSEWMEREAYFDVEKSLPDFRKGDLVRYIVQSNFIVEYEILERDALAEENAESNEEENSDSNIETVDSVAEETTEINEVEEPGKDE